MNTLYRIYNFVGNKLQNNQVENDEINDFSPQTKKELDFNDPNHYNNGTQIKNNEENALLEELNKTKESCNELEQSLKNIKGELSQEKKNSQKYKKQLEKEKKTLNEKVRKLEGDLLQERQNFNFLIGKNQKEKQEFDSKLKVLEENHQRNTNQLNDRYNELESIKKNMKTHMENNINNLEQQLRDQRTKFQQEFKQAHEKYKKNINNIRQKLDEKGNGLRDLEDENARLKEEASKYQSALGVATNTRLGDGDQNHSIKLKNDILKLQNTLDNYVTHLKPNMDLNIKEIQKLAQEYGCLNEITAENPNKIFVKAILQRKVLDYVRGFSHELHNLIESQKITRGPLTLESDIVSKASELLKLINFFSVTRAGTDEVTDASMIKIRQQVYGILGNRGFNNIIDDDGNMRMHDFIALVSNELNKMMNHYRKINDPNRKEQVDAMAPKLIQDIYKLFWFRVNVQEPKTECEYFENVMINPGTMKGSWNEDEIDKLRVDICYFPLVGRNLNSSDAKIFTLAKVFPRYISDSNEPNEENDE
ncbi:hypothetical protein RhiirC2_573046 [Rhizophagus irregularis]|uniref:Uncharacterized protein n=1 Tax=Rhizophagus irregularis TaxID=588596 RepID=A0A2N1N0D3_9GLOM|nr:hypothetical protein RhiirC2_573046 [Rhizophagus irregularis]